METNFNQENKESNQMISCQHSQISTFAECTFQIPKGFQENKIDSYTSLETETNRTIFGKKLTKRRDMSLESVNKLSPNKENTKSQLSRDSNISKSYSCFPNLFDGTHLVKSRKTPGKPIYVSKLVDLLALTCSNIAFSFFLVVDPPQSPLSSQIPEKGGLL